MQSFWLCFQFDLFLSLQIEILDKNHGYQMMGPIMTIIYDYDVGREGTVSYSQSGIRPRAVFVILL